MIMSKDRHSYGTFERTRKGKSARIFQDRIRFKKKAKGINLYRRSVSNITVRANRRKGRFVEITRNIFSKNTNIFYPQESQ